MNLKEDIAHVCRDGKVSMGALQMAFVADGYTIEEITEAAQSLLDSGDWTVADKRGPDGGRYMFLVPVQ